MRGALHDAKEIVVRTSKRKRGGVGNNAGQANLCRVVKKTEAERAFQRAFDDFAWNAFAPIDVGQERMDSFHVQSCRISER